jgi:hypothetical protein
MEHQQYITMTGDTGLLQIVALVAISIGACLLRLKALRLGDNLLALHSAGYWSRLPIGGTRLRHLLGLKFAYHELPACYLTLFKTVLSISMAFSTMSINLTSHLLDLPPAWLALLLQHVACGPRGLANAAALSQSCKFLHSLSEGPAVTYSNIIVAAVISSPDHPVWQWLAKRSGRVAGLNLKLRLEGDDATQYAGQSYVWVQPLETLSSIPDVQLRIEWVGSIGDLDHPYVAQWLKQHGQLISHLTMGIHVSNDRLKLREFAEAAANCRSIDLAIRHSHSQVLDLSDLDAVSASLHRLTFKPSGMERGSLRGATAFNSMSQLATLRLDREDFVNEEPWGFLAKLTSLQQLHLDISARGDPSPLSALTGLSSLYLKSLCFEGEIDVDIPFSFSSLQPLSTLQQLKHLHLAGEACAATSLQGLAGLSKLKTVLLESPACAPLESLEGINPEVEDLIIVRARHLVSLAGIECCPSMEKLFLCRCGVSSLQPIRSLKELEVIDCKLTSLESLHCTSLQSLTLSYWGSLAQLAGIERFSALKSLEVKYCGVTSLQPLSQLGEELRELRVWGCKRVQDEVLALPHVQPTASVDVHDSNVKEVVLAGGVRRACIA